MMIADISLLQMISQAIGDRFTQPPFFLRGGRHQGELLFESLYWIVTMIVVNPGVHPAFEHVVSSSRIGRRDEWQGLRTVAQRLSHHPQPSDVILVKNLFWGRFPLLAREARSRQQSNDSYEREEVFYG